MVLDKCREGKGWCWTGVGRGRDGAGQVKGGEGMVLDRCREGKGWCRTGVVRGCQTVLGGIVQRVSHEDLPNGRVLSVFCCAG